MLLCPKTAGEGPRNSCVSSCAFCNGYTYLPEGAATCEEGPSPLSSTRGSSPRAAPECRSRSSVRLCVEALRRSALTFVRRRTACHMWRSAAATPRTDSMPCVHLPSTQTAPWRSASRSRPSSAPATVFAALTASGARTLALAGDHPDAAVASKAALTAAAALCVCSCALFPRNACRPRAPLAPVPLFDGTAQADSPWAFDWVACCSAVLCLPRSDYETPLDAPPGECAPSPSTCAADGTFLCPVAASLNPGQWGNARTLPSLVARVHSVGWRGAMTSAGHVSPVRASGWRLALGSRLSLRGQARALPHALRAAVSRPCQRLPVGRVLRTSSSRIARTKR